MWTVCGLGLKPKGRSGVWRTALSLAVVDGLRERGSKLEYFPKGNERIGIPPSSIGTVTI